MQSRGDIFTWQSQEVVIASEAKQSKSSHSGMREAQTRNLEIPGSKLRIAPE
jgi:hypothetical protein